MAFALSSIQKNSAVSRFLVTAGTLSVLALTLPGCKETGSSWKGKYTRYAEAVRAANGRTRTESQGTATLDVDTNKITYDVVYGPKNQNHVVQVYTFTPATITKVNGGHDVKLTHISMVKTPPNLGYFPDSGNPLLKVRGKGDNLHLELEFVDTKGTRADVDFSIGGKNLTGVGDADFDLTFLPTARLLRRAGLLRALRPAAGRTSRRARARRRTRGAMRGAASGAPRRRAPGCRGRRGRANRAGCPPRAPRGASRAGI